MEAFNDSLKRRCLSLSTVLKEAQRAPGLLASAYHPDDGVVEALESPAHKLLIGVQCHLEREPEVPKSFLKLFAWLVGWSERYELGDME